MYKESTVVNHLLYYFFLKNPVTCTTRATLLPYTFLLSLKFLDTS